MIGIAANADYCDMLADALAEKAVGNDEAAMARYEEFRLKMGRREAEFALVYDHLLHMSALYNIVFSKSSEPALLV